jgi:hypothetical protein
MSVDQPVLNGLDMVDLYEGISTFGSPDFSSKVNGDTFLFSNNENRLLFESDTMYIPQAGGYCAWGMTGWDVAMCPIEEDNCNSCADEICAGGKCHNCTGCPQDAICPTVYSDISEDCWGTAKVSLDIYDIFEDMRGDSYLFFFLGEGAKDLFSGNHIDPATLPSTYTSNGTEFILAEYDTSQFFATVSMDIWRENIDKFNTDRFL